MTDLPPQRGFGATEPNTDLTAEQAVLGAAMLNPTTIPDIQTTGLTTNTFWRPAHADIWHTITALAAGGAPIDPLTINAELQRRNLSTKTGGATYLHDCMNAVPTTANAGWYATRLVTLATKRRVTQLGRRLVELGQAPATDRDDVFDAATAALADITHAIEDLDVDSAHTRKQVPGDLAFVNFQHLFANPHTDIHWLARPLLAAGRVTTIYAPGKAGKSLIAMEIAAALATGRQALSQENTGELHHVLYIDQEMTPEDWYDRLENMGYNPDDAPLLTEHLHLAQLQAWAPMDTPAGGELVSQATAWTGADTVIIDTQSKVVAGEENSNDTFKDFYRCTVLPLKRAGVAILVLDHTGKDIEKGARGGSAKTDNVDLAFEMLQRGRDTLSFRCSHHRFRLDEGDDFFTVKRRSNPLRHEIQSSNERAEALTDSCLRAIADVNPFPTDKGTMVLAQLKKAGQGWRRETFYAAWATYRYQQGWTQE